MDELRKDKQRDDEDVVMSYELDERLDEERAETGKQLDTMKGQVGSKGGGKLEVLCRFGFWVGADMCMCRHVHIHELFV